jgi:signal transduction histidine kinase/ActR/RegA family two-component response regulator
MMTLIKKILRTGTENLDQASENSIIAVNSFSLVALNLVCIFGVFFYFLTGELQVLTAAAIEAVSFVCMLWLNSRKKHIAAAYGVILTINASLIYYSGILAAIIEVWLAAIFLFGASLLFFNKDKHRIAGIGITLLTVLVCQLNDANPFITPLLKTDMEQELLRWGARPGLIMLDILVIWIYKKNNESLLKSLMQRTQQLEAANTSKNFFIRVTNHELKGPLNAIHEISQTLLLNDDVEENPSLRPLAEDLYTASHTAMQEVTNVLDMSRIEAGKINDIDEESFNIRQFLTNLSKVHQYTANRKQVSIVTEFNDKLPQIIVSDKPKLTKVVGNLLVNAIKFTVPRSKVKLKAYVKDDLLYIAVKDQGKGIKDEKLKTLFDPFETEKNTLIEGTGLGLFITRHFTELLGGQITVHSTQKDGTTFTIHIPLKITAQETAAGSQQKPAAADFSGKRVLICEDNQMSQVYLARFLERAGCTTFLADNGAAGVVIAQKEPLDLVIVDSHMPEMSGKATIEYIRQHPQLRHLPIIVISGDSYMGEDEELLIAGANEYLLKPVDFKTLSEVMRKYLSSPIAIDNGNQAILPPAQTI